MYKYCRPSFKKQQLFHVSAKKTGDVFDDVTSIQKKFAREPVLFIYRMVQKKNCTKLNAP